MITGIEHAAICSPDPKALADWYVSTLGFVISYQSKNAVFVKAPDGNMIEIIPAEGERIEAALRTPGLRHLAISVSDFEAVHADFQGKGVSFIAEPVVNEKVKVVFFTDPEGNILHLLERLKPLS